MYYPTILDRAELSYVKGPGAPDAIGTRYVLESPKISTIVVPVVS